MAEAERRLLAILFTDIVGYTAMVGADEQKGIEAREEHRRVIQTLSTQFHGEFVDESGDASLSIFPSAVDAVKCATAVQAVLAAEPKFQVRIGLHVGDVVERDGRLIGDGINVASRLPAQAEPGGIVATDRVVEHLRNQNIGARPLGERVLKNVAEPVPIYAIGGAAETAAPASKLSRGARIGIAAGAAATLLGVWLFLLGGLENAILFGVSRGIIPLAEQFDQEIAFATTSDGARIAYATAGNPDGPPVVMALGWVTHLERGFNALWVKGLLANHKVLLYDGRGTGLSDRGVDDFSLDAKVRDLEAAVDAAGLDRFGVVAISAGGPTTVAYTLRHPERVARIAFYGSFLWLGTIPKHLEMWKTLPPLVAASWGQDNPVFRQLFSNLFMPSASDLAVRAFNEFQQISMTPEDAAGFIGSLAVTDVRELARGIRVPVLVVHRRGDLAVPYPLGREIAAVIPGAKLVTLEGDNHAPSLEEQEAIEELQSSLTEFFAPDIASR